MRINIVFGSPSDKPVCDRLCQELGTITGLTLKVEICSAHRDPERLRNFIKNNPCDLYITGAGLSAHLPGVVASQTDTPVIGIPCNDILDGMDALLSTMQMPKGVPVLSSGVEKIESVVSFVRWYAVNREQVPVFRVFRPSWADKMTEQLCSPLEKIGWDFVSQTPDVDHPPGVFSLVMADLFTPPAVVGSSESLAQGFSLDKQNIWLGLPIFAQTSFRGDLRLLHSITAVGGLWVGINNITNLQIGLLKLWPIGTKERELISELKGGIKQSVS